MTSAKVNTTQLLQELREREKELRCLYEVDEILTQQDLPLAEVLQQIVNVIPNGWQFTDICQARVQIDDDIYCSPEFQESEWHLTSEVKIHHEVRGSVCICYLEKRPNADIGPFLKQEQELIHSIAERIAKDLNHRQLRTLFEEQSHQHKDDNEWTTILEMLRNTDPPLLARLARKMTNHLYLGGSEEAKEMLDHFSPSYKEDDSALFDDFNRPRKRIPINDLMPISERIFKIAIDYLGKEFTLKTIQKWMREEKSAFLVNVLADAKSSVSDITDAIGRYHHLDPRGSELSVPRRQAFRVSLVRRLLSDQSDFINIAKHHFDLNDFYDLLHRVISPRDGMGKLGGKRAGLALAAKILHSEVQFQDIVGNIKTPKTWYITSAGSRSFLVYNNLEEVFDQKYKDVTQVRFEYPHVIQVFKNSHFPPELVKGIAHALDDLEDTPLIVRSSSLLEDSLGAAFAGKYRSVFIANQGSKQDRLIALLDAISEVYASIFGPDPIRYRAERNLIDFHEEMGIMIQEVVGQRVGDYFFPAYAGVTLSRNDFRWSPRIDLTDGLIRIVPGLGTRAVDRLGDDYPIMIAPHKPKVDVNVTIDEQVRYSPKQIDVINLKTNSFETMNFRDLIQEIGSDYPDLVNTVSVLENDRFRPLMPLFDQIEKLNTVVTFEGLKNMTGFVKQMATALQILEHKLSVPVDLEFASDGKDLYLLQCRPQSYGEEREPAEIPSGVPPDQILFTAKKYVSNGLVKGISHIVYVDSQAYADLRTKEELLSVGRAVGRLNQLLPKRKFILVGPGRWGSRGDIKLGVNVTYSDINNSAMLIEVARKRGGYLPDPSFGTHFFQDLVEASIRYLPIYPDDYGIVFNEAFLTQSGNLLASLAPEFAHLQDTLFVIDVARAAGGQQINIYMNGVDNRAEAHLVQPQKEEFIPRRHRLHTVRTLDEISHWRWRMELVTKIAGYLDPSRYGVKGFYLIGSVKNATAGPESDIDLLIHDTGNPKKRAALHNWLEAWNLAIQEMEKLFSDMRSGTHLDIHYVTDEDIRKKTSFAIKINAITDAAQPIEMGTLLEA